MTRSIQMLILLVTLLSAATAQSVSSDHAGLRATFTTSKGDLIKLDTRTGTLDTPRSRSTLLQDCSDNFQVCLTDHHGFGFAYFRTCNDAGLGDYKRLKFRPKVVSVLHNSDVWMVFDAASTSKSSTRRDIRSSAWRAARPMFLGSGSTPVWFGTGHPRRQS
jgi:hypothetical protein